jgi:hypothetical protein
MLTYAGTTRLANGGLVIRDLNLPNDLPRYREGIEIAYLARRRAAAVRMRNVHFSAEGAAAVEFAPGDVLPPFNATDLPALKQAYPEFAKLPADGC